MAGSPILLALRAAGVVALMATVVCGAAGPAAAVAPTPAAADIPEDRIAALEVELANRDRQASLVRQRLACRNLARQAEALLAAFPTAPNRYRALGVVLAARKALLNLEGTERNRNALFATCTKLADAPDAYAELRLEADLLLSERDLAARDATLAERATALAALVDRYRGTPAEAKSLMIAATIARKLEAFDLENEILRTMDERFSGDPVVIAWRRKNYRTTHLDALFQGTVTRADGTELSFPFDAMGHTCLMVFWSSRTPDFKTHLAALEDLQSRWPDRFDLYSLNLDQLPDAGAKLLRSLGLHGTALRLPGGRQSRIYRTYAARDPLTLRVNAHGHAFVSPAFVDAVVEKTPVEQNLDDERYLAQLQSLFVGDFLVTDTLPPRQTDRPAGSVPAGVLDAIQAGFPPAPQRYRQSRRQTLALYTKAETLCREAIRTCPGAPDLWRVRNRRVVALLGMWNLATEPRYLRDAVEEARAVLAAVPPAGADVVGRFCLAMDALRRGGDPQKVLPDLIGATGGAAAPASAYAAAAILAVQANAQSLYSRYRDALLARPNDNPTLWPVMAFFRDQNHSFRLFKANYYHPPSWSRRAVRAALRRNAATPDTSLDADTPLKAAFLALDGQTVSFPQAAAGKLTLLMFVEPAAEPDSDFPVAINGAVTRDARGRTVQIPGVMQTALALAEQHIDKRIQVIAAFLCDDAARVRALMRKVRWPCQAVLVPGGLAHPLVRRLGILWADRVPNVVLLRDDGTIAWKISGLVHPQIRSEGVGELRYGIELAMKSNIMLCEMARGLWALKQGAFAQAVRTFSGPFPQPEKPRYDAWRAPRLHGRALAQMGQENWQAALADIDAALEAHLQGHAPGRAACDTAAEMRRVRAAILERLGQTQQAQRERNQAAGATTPHRATPYEAFHDELKEFRVGGHAEK